MSHVSSTLNPHVTQEEFEHALRMAEVQAHRVSSRGGRVALSLEDLQQHARIGVVLAALRYNPERGVPFSAWAWNYAYGCACNAARDYSPLSPGRRVQLARLFRGEATPEEARRWEPRPWEREAVSLHVLAREHEWEPGWDGGFDRLPERLVLQQAVAAALVALSPADRELVRRHTVYEQSFEEVAVELGVTRQAISKRWRRIKATLRPLLAPAVQEDDAPTTQ